jgi:ATP/maltotriose-dependent transcriptional regulator MalT
MGHVDQGLELLEQAVRSLGREHDWASLVTQGDLLVLKGTNETLCEARRCFQRAAEDARRWKHLPLELLAVMRQSRLLWRLGRPEQAWEILREAYGHFTGEFDTPLLKEASDLLDRLSASPLPPIV